MRSIGPAEFLIGLAFPFLIVFGFGFGLWKSYRLLVRIKDDIAGIREAVERNAPAPQ